MERPVKNISLEYGDARIGFYEIELKTTYIGNPYLHSHCYYELHFLAGDTFTCSLKDRDITLSRNEFLIVPPDVLHRTNKSTTTREKQFVISMAIEKGRGTEKFYDAFISALEKHKLTPIPFTRDLENILSVFVKKELYEDVLGVCRLKAAAAEFIAWIFGQLLTEKVPLKVGAVNNMVLIDNMINRTDITLDEMAAATNYSKRHISRLIKQRYGCTLTELRKLKKIQKLPDSGKPQKITKR